MSTHTAPVSAFALQPTPQPEPTKFERALQRAKKNAWAAVTGGTIHGLLELPFVVPVEASITQTQINGKTFVWNFKNLFKQRQLYRSFFATALGLVPKCWIHYAFLNFYIGLLIPSGDFKKGTFKESAVCGMATGASEVAFLTPINFVKFRMQRPEWGYTSIFDLFRTVVKTEGPLAFWKGTTPVFFRNSICMLGMVGCYNTVEAKMPKTWPRDLRAFCAGCLCGVIGSFLSYPFEMWRAARVHNVSFIDDMVKKGPKRLFSGYIPGALRICCHSAALGIIIPRMKAFSEGTGYFKSQYKDAKEAVQSATGSGPKK